ncbi:MAG: sugar phosphate isomerase/epimerase [Verrucomicrobia bacterium]|nr:sugar phosphate isomerase/epimerase [Verrucomicrobiota bacterium]
MLSLSSCWNSHRYETGEHIAHDARRLGFDYLELSHGLKVSHLPGLLKAVKHRVIKISSVHNFCPSPVEVMMDAPDAYEFTSHRESDRIRALNLTEMTIETAARIGAPLVVLHLGSVPIKNHTDKLEAMIHAGHIYSREYTAAKLDFVTQRARAAQFYLDRARAALDELLPFAERHQVALCVETRSHYEQVPNESEMQILLNAYRDCPWLGFWHDFGHVQRKANLGLLDHAESLAVIAPRLLGCHVHDVAWPAKDHRVPLSTGGVDFDKLLPLIPKNIPLVWELSPRQKRVHVKKHLAEWRTRFGD